MNNKPITHVAIHKYRHTCRESGIQCHGWRAQILPCGLDSGNPPAIPDRGRLCRNDGVVYNDMPITTDKHLGSNNALLHSTAAHQSGAVLVISLIMLLLLTLIGVTGSQVTGLEEKMAGNMRQHNLAFQAAEAALRDAEQFIFHADEGVLSDNPLKSLFLNPPLDCASGLCRTTTPAKWAASDFNWTTKGKDSGAFPSVVNNPRYVIEYMSMPGECNSDDTIKATFRITAFAWGGDANATAKLQTIYRVNMRPLRPCIG